MCWICWNRRGRKTWKYSAERVNNDNISRRRAGDGGSFLETDTQRRKS
jgi:hypothetical protein